MATPVMMPNVGITVESCILTTWHKKKGDAVKKGDILFNGHTHVCKIEELGDIIYANPGSVSIPKEDTPRGYMILEDEKIIHKSLNGELLQEYPLA